MIITLSTGPNDAASTTWPATDLGYLLHKHPGRLQSFDRVGRGRRTSSIPRPTAERCTAALLLEVDPVGLVRGQAARPAARRSRWGSTSTTARTRRPSMLSVALTKVFRTAMTGRCDARPELAAARHPAGDRACPRCRAAAAPTWPSGCSSRSAGGSRRRRCRWIPSMPGLGRLALRRPAADRRRSGWPTRSTTCTCCCRCWTTPSTTGSAPTRSTSWSGPAAAGWPTHPEKALITERYLRRRSSLTRAALARLAEVDDLEPEALDDADEPAVVVRAGREPVPLAEQRREAVLAAVRAAGRARVGDLGCGEGALVADLLADADHRAGGGRRRVGPELWSWPPGGCELDG